MLALSLVALLPLAAQEARFVEGDLAEVACKVAKFERDGDRALLTLEVTNRAKTAFEPLVFALTAAPEGQRKEPLTVELERAPLPHVGRVGRPVPGRGEELYTLHVSMWELPKKLEARVVEGLFLEGPPKSTAVADEPIDVGRIEHETIRTEAGTVPSTRVRVANRLDVPLDAIFRARYKAPFDGVLTVTLSLAAKEERDWTIATFPSQTTWDTHLYLQGAKIDRLELVDWCARLPVDPAPARERLLAAYREWERWPAARPALQGRFRYTYRYMQEPPAVAEGTFHLDPDGSVKVDSRGDDRGSASEIRSLLAELARPSAEELAEQSDFVPLSRRWTGVAGPGWERRSGGWQLESRGLSLEGLDTYAVEDGRIIAWRLVGGGAGTRWRTTRIGERWVVVARESVDGGQREHTSYARLGDLVVPVSRRFRMIDARGEASLERALELSELALATPAPSLAPPAGAGVDAVRAAWAATYRYPDEPVTLRARFEVETPGTDLVWGGVKTVRGEVVLEGFRGFLGDRAGWTRMKVDVDDLPDMTRDVVAAALSDRFLLWAFRDFAGRAPFERAFAGATIEPTDDADEFAVTNGPFARVVVHGGRVVALGLGPKTERVHRFANVGGEQVPARITTGEEELDARWRKIDGRLVPVEFEFRAVFGRDWGPERIELSDVELE